MTDAEHLKLLLDRLKAGGKLTSQERKFVAQAQRAPEFYATKAEIAKHYGVVRSALDRWEQLSPEAFVKDPKRGYDADLIAEARRKFVASGKKVRLNEGDVKNAKTGGGEVSEPDNSLPGTTHETLEQIKIRKSNLDCIKVAEQIDLARRLTVKRSLAERVVMAFAIRVRDSMLRVPAEVCYAVSGKTPAEAQEIMIEAITAKLNKMDAEDLKQVSMALEGDGEGDHIATRMPALRETNGRHPGGA